MSIFSSFALADKRAIVLEFILDKTYQSSIERCVELEGMDDNGIGSDESFLGFNSYDEFKQTQTFIIQNSGEEVIDRSYMMVGMINSKLIRFMDMEDCASSEGEGFFFDRRGKLVMFRER